MGKTARHWGEKMNLKEAAQQALEALEEYQAKGAPFMSCDAAVETLRAALAESNQFHITNQSENVPYIEVPAELYKRPGLLRAALAKDATQRFTDEQQMIERGTKAWADVQNATAWVEDLRGNEPVTICHEKEGDKLSPPLAWYDPSNGAASTDKNDPRFTPLGQLWPLYCASGDIEETEEQRMLRRKWFGGRDTGHLSFVEAVDATMMKLHKKLDRLAGTWKMADAHIPDATKMVEECAYPECLSTNGCEKQCPAFPRSKDDHIPGATKMVASNHIADANKMVATINKMETVEPVAYVTGFSKGYAIVEPFDRSLLMPVGMALYRSPPKRDPLTDAEIGAVAADIWGSILIAPQSYQQFARAIERAHGIRGKE